MTASTNTTKGTIMARKKHSNRNRLKVDFPNGFHFLFSTDELFEDFTIVRYLGEQEEDLLLCYHPEGFSLWCHISHLAIPRKRVLVAA